MPTLMRWSWYTLPWLLWWAWPGFFASSWYWVGFFGCCWWLGEIGYRWWIGWVIGEYLEDREVHNGKKSRQLAAVQAELAEATRAAKQQRSRDRRDESRLDDLRYKLRTARTDLRKARRYIDEMTAYFGPLPEKSGKKSRKK